MPAGIGAQGYSEKLWTLDDLDRNEVIVGQFIPQDVSRRVGGNIAELSSVNAQYPILQWVGGETEEITFNARLWAKDSEDFTVEDRLERLEELVRRNDDLERPPVCTFAWGNVASLMIDCLVKSIGGITYDEVRDDGSLRGVTLQITLLRYEEPDFKVTDSSTPEKFTRRRRAKRGDTYEAVALLEYGDPLLGVLLRQLNPRIPGMRLADLRARDPIHVYPEDYLVTLPVEPEFHAFKSGDGYEAAEERRREILDDRGGDSYVTIFPEGGS
jgi:hypothetical protein